MEILTLFLSAVICFFIGYLLLRTQPKKAKGMPPSPPISELIKADKSRMYLAHTAWRSLGEVLTIRRDSSFRVVLNSWRAIQEAYNGSQADIFAGRSKMLFSERTSRMCGIMVTDGPLWHEHRRFALRWLREFGMGRPMGEAIVREECEALREKIVTEVGHPVKTMPLFMASINNIIARITFGERCGTDDPEFQEFTRALHATLQFRLIDRLAMRAQSPLLSKILGYFSGLDQGVDGQQQYIRKKIEKQRQILLDMESPPTELDQASCLCEVYLIEQARQENARPGAHTFTEWQLIRNMLELFLAGTETTSSTLTWATLLLAVYQDVQTRAQQEVEDKVGRDRMATMSDRTALPYVCAVLDEVMRFSSLVPDGVTHRAMQDTELMGFFIPKDTPIISNMWIAHRDPELWAKPEEFYPEHFLTKEGEYRQSKHLIPFSVGKRACLGESLARQEIFMALVTLLQTFNIRLSDNKANIKAIFFGTQGHLRRPLEHEIVFTKIDSS